jgi:glycosyltransferase involved in cell wall biosynthesis
MKVAYCIRQDWDSPKNKGGDTTQLLKTMNNVLKHDPSVTIEVLTDPNQLDSSFDLVHIFNFATLDISTSFFNKAKSLDIKIAFSTIFWDYSYGYHFISKYIFSKLSINLDRLFSIFLGNVFNKPIVLSRKFKRQILLFLEGSDVLLPNSIEEYYKICEFVKIDPNIYLHKVDVIFNAADVNENEYLEKNEFLKKYNLPDQPYILQVGRIQLIKGQLNVVRAMKNHTVPIVFVGFVAEKDYYQKIKKLGDKRGNVYFVDYVENKEVCNFYKYAALHVLPSLRESPGLVSLEALLNECKIVAANEMYCPFETYFSNIATKIDSNSIKSLESGILTELEKERDFGYIKELILNKFSWKKVGIDTYNSYKKIL